MTWRPSSPRQQPTRPKSEHRAWGAGFTLGLIFKLTKIDCWFPVQIKEIADFEEELAGRRIESHDFSCIPTVFP
jgi:Carbamoyl-phosphate synthetase large chain, oligomerisation domain